MGLQVWFSVQSDSGITLGEMGSLASETDSKLIASTLQALKDIVSVEASDEESQFMTGAVETSSFGTFAISSSDEYTLVLSYIISVPSSETVTDKTEKIIQGVCTNFGKQLTQVKTIGDMAKSGARIPDELLFQAYLNAVTIIQMDQNIEIQPKQMTQDLNEIISRFTSDNEKIKSSMKHILTTEFLSNQDFWFNGFPSKIAQEELLDKLSTEIVKMLVFENPLTMLNSVSPRVEYLNVKKLLEIRLNDTYEDYDRLIINNFEDLMLKQLDDFVNSLSLLEMHSVDNMIYNEFLKRSFLHVAKTSPAVFFHNFSRSKIRITIKNLIPNNNYIDFGTVMKETVNRNTPSHIWNLVDAFYDTLTKEMIGKKLSIPAVDLSLLFAQYFIEPTALKSEIDKFNNLQSNWRKELLSLIPPIKVSSLEVNSIEDAVNLSNAAGNTIITVLVEIIKNYFIGDKESLGEIPASFCQFYNDISSKIKTSNIILAIFRSLEELDGDNEFITPQAVDIIGAYMMEKKLSFFIDNVIHKTKKKFFGPYVVVNKNETVLFFKKLQELSKFVIQKDNDEELEIDLNHFKFSELPEILLNEDSLLKCVEVSTQRRIQGILLPHFKEYGNKLLDYIDRFVKKVENEELTVKDVKRFKFNLPQYEFDKVNFGAKIHAINLEILNQLQSKIEDIFRENHNSLLSKLNDGESLRRAAKTLSKLDREIENVIEDVFDEYENKLTDEANKVTEQFKNHRTIIQNAIKPNKNEILQYDYESQGLVRTEDQVQIILNEYLENNYGKSLREDEILKFNLGVKLFDTLSNTLFENPYDQIISGNLSSRTINIKERSTSKLEFEENLRDMGRLESYNLFQALSDILSKCSSLYINRDGVVSSDSNYLKLHLGRLKLSSFSKKELISDLIRLPNLIIERDRDSWLVSYGFTRVSDNKERIPNILTFKDTVHYIQKLEFIKELDDILIALKDVGSLIENDTNQRIDEVRTDLFDAIFTEF